MISINILMETADVGIGSMGEEDIPDSGDFYAPGDARVPKVLGKKKKPLKRITFKEWIQTCNREGTKLSRN